MLMVVIVEKLQIIQMVEKAQLMYPKVVSESDFFLQLADINLWKKPVLSQALTRDLRFIFIYWKSYLKLDPESEE